MALVKIEVTEEDIAKGVKWNPVRCPVAKGIRRVLGKGKKLEVDGYSLSITSRNGETDEVDLPKKVHKFVDRFDDGRKVKPISFCLRMKE